MASRALNDLNARRGGEEPPDAKRGCLREVHSNRLMHG